MDVREKSSNGKRLIDAEAFLEKMKRTSRYFDVVFDVEEMPTVDAVEVVRCKDCKHYKPQKKSAHWENRANYCNRIVTIKVQPYDFCSYGVRKDGADNG